MKERRKFELKDILIFRLKNSFGGQFRIVEVLFIFEITFYCFFGHVRGLMIQQLFLVLTFSLFNISIAIVHDWYLKKNITHPQI